MRRTSEAVRVRLRWAIADETGRRASDVACCMVPITVRLRLHAMLCVWGGTPEDAITSIRLGFRSHAGLQDGAGKRHIAVRDTSNEVLSADAV